MRRLSLLLLLPICACGRNPFDRELESRPKQRLAAAAKAPAGCRWITAEVQVSLERMPEKEDEPPRWTVGHWLVLRGPDREHHVPLRFRPEAQGSKDLLDFYEEEPTLKFTTDGRAVCVSDGTDSRWNVVYLDAATRPILLTSVQTPSGGDPLPLVPSTREAVKTVLMGTRDLKGHMDARVWMSAIEFVADHGQDGELLDLLALALRSTSLSDLHKSFIPSFVAFLKDVVQARKETVEILRESLRRWIRSPDESLEFLVVLLEDCRDDETLQVAAEALRVSSADRSLHRMSCALLFVLEGQVEAADVGSQTVDALVATANSGAFIGTRLHALRGLWAIDSETTRAALANLSGSSVSGVSVPAWPETPDAYREAIRGTTVPMETWAKSALLRRPARK